MSESNESSDTNSEDTRLVSNPVLKIFLEGLYDKDCHLSKLRGCPYIVMRIWKEVRNFWGEKITLPPINDEDSFKKSGIRYDDEIVNLCKESFKSETYFAPVHDMGKVGCYAHMARKYSFPEPTDINVIMIPFIAGQNFKYCELPNYLQNYWPLIKACLRPQHERQHSTANPLGVEPDRNVTKIVVGNKFSEEGVEVIEHSVEAAERQQRGGKVPKGFEDCRYQM